MINEEQDRTVIGDGDKNLLCNTDTDTEPFGTDRNIS